MTREDKLFEMLRKLSFADAKAIDRIAHEVGMNQNTIMDMHIEFMQMMSRKMKADKESSE